jgi:para-aminobenzoate synthetase component 1
MDTRLPLHADVDLPGPPSVLFDSLLGLPGTALLESQMELGSRGRFAFAAVEPFLTLRSHGSRVETESNGCVHSSEGDPFLAVRDTLCRYACPPTGHPAPLQGGAVGFLSYDLGRMIERLPCRTEDDLALPDICLNFYDAVLAFDRVTGRATVFSTGHPCRGEAARRARAHERVEQWQALIDKAYPGEAGPVGFAESGVDFSFPELRSNFTHEEYVRAVQRARQYIIDGDIFQVNLSQRFEMPLRTPVPLLYRRLREINPAPFSAYLDHPDLKIVSASPERYLRVIDGRAEIRPIKGTRPRGSTPEEDESLRRELRSSAKDRAENTMIVDLVRNDLGRVCRYGTVKVLEHAVLETFPSVFHLTSTVAGELRQGLDAVDAIRASFPDGSITGAPKIRAMEIIEELEPVRRGVYTGALGYFSFSGPVDLNVAIRTITVRGGRATFSVGGGIVYDSDPEMEYQETLHKGRALARTLVSLARVSLAGEPESLARG